MNQLQSSSILPDRFIADEAVDGGDSTYTWALVGGGLVFAGVAAGLVCKPLQGLTVSWWRVLLDAAAYVAMTVAAGAAGVWAVWLCLMTKPAIDPVTLAKYSAAGWVFLPCIALLGKQGSLWILPVSVAATVVLAGSLRMVLAGKAEVAEEDVAARGDLMTLYGLPQVGRPLWQTALIAVLGQAAVVFAAMGMFGWASAMVAPFLFVLLWRWRTPVGKMKELVSGWRLRSREVALGVLAILLTTLVLSPWIGGRGLGLLGAGEMPRQASAGLKPVGSSTPVSGYMAVVLLPPPIKQKSEIVPPRPHTDQFAMSAAKPLMIPFDGPYWYFKAPDKAPGPKARVAHGKPTDFDVNVRSTDWLPLMMEAHQLLSSSIDLGCCREIDVSITNADNRPGRIELGVVLTDSRQPGRPSQYLGTKVMGSSVDPYMTLNRPAVEDVVRFQIPQVGRLERFDEITVVFLPARERARAGVKASIKGFVLVPR